VILLDFPHLTKLLDQLLIVEGSLLDVLQRLVVVLARQSLEIADELLHVLELAIKFFNCFGVLLFLVLDFTGMGLYKPLVNCD